MKKILFATTAAFYTALSFAQVPGQGQDNTHVSNVDIALLNLRVDSFSHANCNGTTVFISFDIRNSPIGSATTLLKFQVAGTETPFNIVTPATCQPGIPCISLAPRQTIHVRAATPVQTSWIENIQAELKVTGGDYDIGGIHFHDTNPLNNTVSNQVNFSGASSVQTGFCLCASGSRALIDTSAVYAIQGYVKKQVGNLNTAAAFVAVPFNLKPSLTVSDAAQFKFRFAGNFENDPTIPMYLIEFRNTGSLVMTRDNNQLTFSAPNGSNNQRWILKKNNQGGYGIFSIRETNRPCLAWGPTGSQPLPDSPLILSNRYDPSSVFQYFNLVKIE